MQTILIRALFLLVAAITIATPCDAAVRRIVKVSYEQEFGWSREVKVEVTFASGSELNAKAHQLRLRPFELYALIWFKDDQVAIVKLDNKPLLMGLDGFTAENFKDLYFIKSEAKGTQVNDDGDGQRWNFKAKDIITWIDPRVED
jgi:hypothetical protein